MKKLIIRIYSLSAPAGCASLIPPPFFQPAIKRQTIQTNLYFRNFFHQCKVALPVHLTLAHYRIMREEQKQRCEPSWPAAGLPSCAHKVFPRSRVKTNFHKLSIKIKVCFAEPPNGGACFDFFQLLWAKLCNIIMILRLIFLTLVGRHTP